MALKYSCFISYCHGHGELMTMFVTQLKAGLTSSIEPYLDEEVYLDEERLKPGYLFNPAIARAICESICMVAVLVPKYLHHEYCRRELETMARVEKTRSKKLGGQARHKLGMIIPVLFRGRLEDQPAQIQQRRHCADLSGFCTSSAPLSGSPAFNKEIEAIAQCVHELYQRIGPHSTRLTQPCASLALPSATDAKRWKPRNPQQALPFR